VSAIVTVIQPLSDHMREKHGQQEPQTLSDDQLTRMHGDQHQNEAAADHSHPAENPGVFYGDAPSPSPE
jgi:hypothetical protein